MVCLELTRCKVSVDGLEVRVHQAIDQTIASHNRRCDFKRTIAKKEKNILSSFGRTPRDESQSAHNP